MSSHALLERLVAVELRAVVGGDGPDGPRLPVDELLEPRVQLGGRAPVQVLRSDGAVTALATLIACLR